MWWCTDKKSSLQHICVVMSYIKIEVAPKEIMYSIFVVMSYLNTEVEPKEIVCMNIMKQWWKKKLEHLFPQHCEFSQLYKGTILIILAYNEFWIQYSLNDALIKEETYHLSHWGGRLKSTRPFSLPRLVQRENTKPIHSHGLSEARQALENTMELLEPMPTLKYASCYILFKYTNTTYNVNLCTNNAFEQYKLLHVVYSYMLASTSTLYKFSWMLCSCCRQSLTVLCFFWLRKNNMAIKTMHVNVCCNHYWQRNAVVSNVLNDDARAK